MSRLLSTRRVLVGDLQIPKSDNVEDSSDNNNSSSHGGGIKHQASGESVTEDQEPFMGIKARRNASLFRECLGDYLDVRSQPHLNKILQKQGDKQINFADKVLKFTATGRMKRRILIVTDYAIYLFDPETHALKRRIALAAVEKICLSELKDNFFSIIIPTEYDLLMASTRKTEIVNVIVDTVKSTSDYEPEVKFSNGFEYNAAADFVKVVQFEEVEGGVKTRILDKSVS